MRVSVAAFRPVPFWFLSLIIAATSSGCSVSKLHSVWGDHLTHAPGRIWSVSEPGCDDDCKTSLMKQEVENRKRELQAAGHGLRQYIQRRLDEVDTYEDGKRVLRELEFLCLDLSEIFACKSLTRHTLYSPWPLHFFELPDDAYYSAIEWTVLAAPKEDRLEILRVAVKDMAMEEILEYLDIAY